MKAVSENNGQPPDEAVDGGRLDADGRDALEALRAFEIGRVLVITVRLRVREEVLQNFGQILVLDWS